MTKHFIKLLFATSPLLFFSINLNAQEEPEYYGGEAGKKLDWTLYYLNKHYVDSTDTDKLAELAIIRMFKELDPFSKYQSKEQLDAQKKADSGIKNDGIGIRYYVINDTATVIFVDETGPAHTSGLLKGDKIISINNINTIGQNFGTVDNLILAPRGTVLNFKVRRNLKPLDLTITSVSLFAASVDAAYRLDGNIGYIRLNRFTSKTPGEVKEALIDLKAQGMQELIIDLRGNRGGVVTAATALVDQFLPKKKLIMSSEGHGLPKSEVFSTEEGLFQTGKVAILTNSVTASASEIFTGAMQEWDRALVVGEITYGKGLIQQSYLLGDSAAVRLTIGRYFTPTGRMLQRPFDFDSTKDWMYQNIANAVHHDDFTKELRAPLDNQWSTYEGRNILKGNGSIIPDLYLSPPTVDKPQLKKLNDTGLIYRFVAYHGDKYRAYYLHTYKDGNDFRQLKDDDVGIKNEFMTFMNANLQDKALLQSIKDNGISPHVMTQIKAWLAPQVWEIGSYFSVLNAEDPVVLRAVKAMRDGTYAKIGIR